MWKLGYRFCSIVYALIRDICDRFYLAYWGSWCLIRFTRHSDRPIWMLNNWLTDFVFVPVVVHTSLVLSNYLLHRKEPLKYTLGQIMFFSCYTSIIFELLLPRITTYNTGDWVDVAMYFSGGIFYYYIHQKIYVLRQPVMYDNPE